MNTTTFNGVRITLYGHSSVGLEFAGLIVYVDPFVAPKSAKPGDLILHTHGHFDHCALPAHLQKPSTSIIASRSCKHPGQVADAGQSLKFGPLTVQVVEAYNLNKPYHKRDEGVGYIFSFASGAQTVRIYVAGDTDRIPEMKQYKCDVAILPIGGTYTMNMQEAAQALADLKPKIAIPCHYNYLEGQRLDASAFKQAVAASQPGMDVRLLLG